MAQLGALEPSPKPQIHTQTPGVQSVHTCADGTPGVVVARQLQQLLDRLAHGHRVLNEIAGRAAAGNCQKAVGN